MVLAAGQRPQDGEREREGGEQRDQETESNIDIKTYKLRWKEGERTG